VTCESCEQTTKTITWRSRSEINNLFSFLPLYSISFFFSAQMKHFYIVQTAQGASFLVHIWLFAFDNLILIFSFWIEIALQWYTFLLTSLWENFPLQVSVQGRYKNNISHRILSRCRSKSWNKKGRDRVRMEWKCSYFFLDQDDERRNRNKSKF
jgi:hypothetical protein